MRPLKISAAVSLALLTVFAFLSINKSDAAQISKVLLIHQINAQKPTHGIFITQGYVAKICTAPACSPGAQCKPSMADNIVISEDKKNLETYDLSNREMIIFTSKTAVFKKGKKYQFQIKVTDRKTTNAPINDVALLRFRLLDS